ncbi:MAG TPA: hypothetical protein VMI54_15305 [Polyangiaceae bacterium]|nr:hypothetical protein [Polyangiaceae bacterium]
MTSLGGLASCHLTVGPSGDDDDDESGCPHVSCHPGDVICLGDWVEQCEYATDGCLVWYATTPCGLLGGTCTDSACHFEEACADGVDAFCRDDYVLGCANGRVGDAVACNCEGCTKTRDCLDLTLANGRKAAACAVTPMQSCSTDAPVAAECHGSEADECAYGVVTSRTDCGTSECTLVENALLESEAVCAQ